MRGAAGYRVTINRSPLLAFSRKELRSAAMLMEHIGQQEVYQRVEASVRKTLAEGKGLTRDLGGDGTTATITERLVANLPA